jgi:hypothetical protein
MKITIKQMREGAVALNDLGAMKLPAPLSLRVMLSMKALRDPVAAFDETFNKLLSEMGKPIKKSPGQFEIAKENVDAFNAASTALHAEEIELNIKPIKLSAFGNAEIAPQTLLALDWMIEQDIPE